MREEELLEYIEKLENDNIKCIDIIGNKSALPYHLWYEEQGKKWREFENSATKIVKK